MKSPLNRASAPALMLTLFALAVPQTGHACSMCQCGDPTYRLLGDGFVPEAPWRTSFEMDHLAKDQVAESDPAAREREAENRFTLSSAWAPLSRVRVIARVPVVSRTITAPDGTTHVLGLSDPDAFAHVRVFERMGTRADWLAVMAGVKTPWGQNDRTADGVRGDEHLQPGTGATSEFAGLAYSLALSSASHAYASVMGRWNGTNGHDYRYGDMFMANVSFQRAISTRAALAADANFRSTRKDHNAGELDENTGGRVLYLAPRIQIALNRKVALKLGVQLPVWQSLFGDQNEHVNLQSGVAVVL